MKKIRSTVLACGFVFTFGSHALAAEENVNQVGNSEEIIQNLEVKDLSIIIEESRDYIEQGYIDLILKIVELKEENPTLSNEEIQGILNRDILRSSITHKFGTDLISISSISDSLGRAWDDLTAAEKRLVVTYPQEALIVKRAQSKTDRLVGIHYPGWIDGDEGNAYRHALWNAIMSRDAGKNMAELFATAHENQGLTDAQHRYQVWNGFNGLQHKNMDLHNNQMGRNLFNGWLDNLLTDGSLSSRVKNAIQDGKAKILVK